MHTAVTVILGLGSNMGNRHAFLTKAVALTRLFLKEVECSSRYETAALLLPGSPPEWDIPFLNMAVKGTTLLSPQQLLHAAKAIEQQLGRQERGRWSPREIDVDILAYGEEVVADSHLHIPHKELLNRSFALTPFAEIHPDWCYPVTGEHYGKTARELTKQLTNV